MIRKWVVGVEKLTCRGSVEPVARVAMMLIYTYLYLGYAPESRPYTLIISITKSVSVCITVTAISGFGIVRDTEEASEEESDGAQRIPRIRQVPCLLRRSHEEG